MYDRQDGRARDNEHGKVDVDRDPSTGGLGESSDIFWVLREGDARRDGRSIGPVYRRICLPAGRIGDGEVACLPRSA